MENIDIKGFSGDYFIPTVKFNSARGECLIEGESYLEDTMSFYRPLIQWIEDYIETIGKPLKFDFKLNYFNTSSSKRILDILLKLKAYQENGGQVNVTWHFEEEDPDIEEDVDDFMIITKLDIQKQFE